MGFNLVTLINEMDRTTHHKVMASVGHVHYKGQGSPVIQVGPFQYRQENHIEIQALSELSSRTHGYRDLQQDARIIIYQHDSPCAACAKYDARGTDASRIFWWARKLNEANKTARLKLVFRDYYTAANRPGSRGTFRDERAACETYATLMRALNQDNGQRKGYFLTIKQESAVAFGPRERLQKMMWEEYIKTPEDEVMSDASPIGGFGSFG